MNIRDCSNRYEKYLKLRLKNSPNLLLLLDKNGLVEFISDSFLKILGEEKSNLILNHPFSVIYKLFASSSSAEKGVESFERIKNGGYASVITIKADFTGRSKMEPYLVQLIPLLDNDDSFEGMQIIFYNENTMLRAEAEEQLRSLMEFVPLACTLRDMNNNIITCNIETARMFGVSSKEEVVRLFDSFYPDFQPDGTPSKQKIKDTIKILTEKGSIQYDYMYKDASGENLPVESTAVMFPWGESYRMAVYSRDLRNIWAKDEAIRQAENASAAKSSFLANMSHEIRTPMGAIIGLSELIRTDNFDKQQKEFFEDIKKMSRALLKIINDILDFSKIEVNKMTLSPVHFNLRELMENTVSIFRFTAQGKDIDFEYSYDPGVMEIVFGDDVRVRQVVTNILNNAIKYTRQGSVKFCVKSVFRNEKQYTVFCVTDTGIGIRTEDIPKLFSQFEQFDSRINRDIVGTGLGLAISKRLADMMDGFFEVESEYGKGSVFSVFLPLQKGDPGQIPKMEEICMIVADPSIRVLVVDDNPLNLKIANIYLSKFQIKAEFAEGGAEALEMIKKNKYDLIFMDHMMPVMDGLEATSIIRTMNTGEWYKTVPIVALTANAVEGTRELFLRMGMNDFISKPIELKELNRVLTKWLPPGKISCRVSEDDASSMGADPVLSALSEGDPVLNRVVGLSNAAGDGKLLFQLLRDFRKVHREDVVKLKASWEAGDRKTACRLAHTLKSSSAIIGGEQFSRIAFEAEKALAENSKESITIIEMIIAELEPAFAILVREVDAFLSTDVNQKVKLPFDREKALPLIGKLLPLLESSDASVFGFREEIESVFSSYENDGEELINLIDEFEFPRAAKLLSRIKEKLGAG